MSDLLTFLGVTGFVRDVPRGLSLGMRIVTPGHGVRKEVPKFRGLSLNREVAWALLWASHTAGASGMADRPGHPVGTAPP